MSCGTVFVLRDPDQKLRCIHEKEEHGICESAPFESPQARFGPKRLVRVLIRAKVVRVLALTVDESEDGTAVARLATS